jgi:protein-S-isoprenylcysteine O-methyltransferase Ste14
VSNIPVVSWVLAMDGFMITLLLLLCLIMNLSLYLSCRINRNEPWLDVFFKMLGSNYFTLFILHRVNMEVIFSRNNPDYDFSPWYWVNWSLGMVMFVLFAGSYLTRSNPIARANRLREIIYPLFVGSLPMLVFESFSFNQYEFIQNSEWLSALFKPFANIGPGHWSTVSIALILFGHSISVWALVYLRRSFGILTEVRNLVTKGPYRFVRHPLYVGENFAAIGFCFMFPSWFNIAITILFLLSQRLRAHFEEQKFRSTLPDYERYMKRVGAYLPRLNKTQKS